MITLKLEMQIPLRAFTLSTGNDSGNSTLVVNEAIPGDSLESGAVRITLNDDTVIQREYTSWTGSTFALNGTLPENISSGNAAETIPYIKLGALISDALPSSDINFLSINHSHNGTANIRRPLAHKRIWSFSCAVTDLQWKTLLRMYDNQRLIKPFVPVRMHDYLEPRREASQTRTHQLADGATSEQAIANMLEYYSTWETGFTAKPSLVSDRTPGAQNKFDVTLQLIET